MCRDCGCGITGEYAVGGKPAGDAPSPLLAAPGPSGPGHGRHSHGADPGGSHDHGAGQDHGQPPDHDRAHDHGSGPGAVRQTLDVQRSLLEKNDRLAERNRGFFRAKGLLVLNVLSSPGSGKTTLIQATARALAPQARVGVIVGDLATDNDAARLRSAGIPVVQITTGTVCHLEADMVARAAGQLDLDALDVLIIENVGNLVCPADFDLGEDLRVVLLSVTEGEDKPLKYPPLFHSAHVVLVTKCDLAAAVGFDRTQALANLQRISHHASLFEVAARTGQGLEAWVKYLLAHRPARP